MKLTVGTGKIAKVQLYNVQGIMVLETKPDSSNVVDLSRLSPGGYVVKVNQVNGIISTRRIQIVK
jgi:allantoicase